MSEFIFMLTRHDRTVEDCLEIMDTIADLGVRHIGFKDMGMPLAVLSELNRRIQASGATSYLEVVSTTPRDCLHAARSAVEIGVDRLLGGSGPVVADMLALLAGSHIEYLPFPGQAVGHPARLHGTLDDIARDCRRYGKLGCAGVDLLAYRACDADPLELVHTARAATDGWLIVAGSVDSPARIRALCEAGVDAFTVGTAVFNARFATQSDVRTQLQAVLAAGAA